MINKIVPVVLIASLCFGGKKQAPQPGRYSNDNLEITATPVVDREAIKQLLGGDLGGSIVVVEVKITPKGDNPLNIIRDDFWLRTDRDGQQTQPFAPSQIAGRSVLIVNSSGEGGAVMGKSRGPVWGGGGRSRRGSGNDGGSSRPTTPANTEVKGDEAKGDEKSEEKKPEDDKDSPLLATLKAKILPEAKTSDPVSGLLYFPMEGKQKVKDLEMYYKGPAGKFSIRFK